MMWADSLLWAPELRADAVEVEHAVAVAGGTGPALAAADPPCRLRSAHQPAGTVHGREQRLLGLTGLDALEDHRVVAHRPPDEALLARPRRRASLADHPVCAPEVLLPPREVVVVVHLIDRVGT